MPVSAFPTAFAIFSAAFCLPAFATPPVAVADAWTVEEDGVLSRNAAQGVLANDIPSRAGPGDAGLVTAPQHGTVVLAPDGSFTYTPQRDYAGPDSFSYRSFGPRSPVTFTIDEPNSTLTVSTTLRVTFQGVPSISTDSTTSNARGTLVASIAPGAAPYSLVQVSDLDAILTDALQLKLGVGCIPIINTCLGGVQFDSPANALTLSMTSSAAVASVRANGGFDADGALFSLTGEGTVKGTEQLEPLLPVTALPLTFPVLPVPFNGRITDSGGKVRLEMQINFRGTVGIDASTSLTFGVSGVIRGLADPPLPAVEASEPATVSITVTPVNDAPRAAPDSYLVRAGTELQVSAAGAQVSEDIITAGAVWKYLHNGVDQGTTWRAWQFSDAAWLSGAAELGYGDGNILGGNRPEATNIRPSGAAARPTAYFRREFTVSDVNSTRSLSLELLRDDGAAVYLNGIEIARQNLAAGAGYSTLALSRIPNADETRYFPESVSPALLLEGRNTLAVEVHQFSTSDSILPLDPADVSFNLRLSRQKGLTGVLVNDTDPEGDALTVALHQLPANGTVQLDADGAFRYTPAAGFTGRDSFLYRVQDGGTQDAEIALVPAGASWKYLDDGSDQGTAWRAPGFSDSSWATGNAEIGYGDDNTLDDRPETTKLTYLLTTPPVTTWFRKKFTLPVPKAMLKSLTLRLLRDDGAAVYLNGVEIARDNLAAGAAFDSGATLPVEGEAEGTFFSYAVPPVGLAALVDGENVLAVELHQNLQVSNDASFDCELRALATPGGRVTLDVTAEDFDQDQIADSWERARGLDFAIADGSADPDGDGRTNREEFLADTDPLQRSSHLRIDAVQSTAPGTLEVTFPASTARRYVLQTSPDMAAWTDASPPHQATGATGSIAVPVTGGTRFYRLLVDYQWP